MTRSVGWMSILLLSSLLLLSPCSSLRLLVLHPFYSGSHVLSLNTLSNSLVNLGHNVTTVRFADPHGLQLASLGPGHKEVLLHMNNSEGKTPYLSKEEKASFQLPLNLMWSRGHDLSTLFRLDNPWTLIQDYCHQLLADQALYEELEWSSFDVVVLDLIYNECGLALARALKLPVVGYWAFSLSSGEAEFTLASTPPSHIPVFMSELSDSLGFRERLINFLAKIFARSVMIYHTWVCDHVIAQYWPQLPSSRQMLADLNGMLINSHPVLDTPRLMPESFINVGGMQIKKDANLSIPSADLKEWMDEAKSGVIVFSLGFIFSTQTVPMERLRTILNALAILRPMRIVLKLDSLPSELVRPENVFIAPFLPQQAVLAHNNTRVFVTHCGMHGVMEAVYFGVPMVGMPLFGDQTDVLVKMVDKGIAVGISKLATEDDIVNAVHTVINNNEYRENVGKLSRLMHLDPVQPMSKAVTLLEYVAATKGAEHLIPSSRHLNFLQYTSLDVVIVIVLLLTILFKLMAISLNKALLIFTNQKGQTRALKKPKSQ